MRSKGVAAHQSQPAVLKNWRLAFNINHPFQFEGKVANVVRAPNDSVHGALYSRPNESLQDFDALEYLGVYYERIELDVITYAGKPQTVFVYVDLPATLKDEGHPSQRYRNILVQGAHEIGFSRHYIDWLGDLQTYPQPSCPPFEPPVRASEKLTLEQVSSPQEHTALAGYVFDMSAAAATHSTMKPILVRHNVTLLFSPTHGFQRW